jgi:hypothetical protein
MHCRVKHSRTVSDPLDELPQTLPPRRIELCRMLTCGWYDRRPGVPDLLHCWPAHLPPIHIERYPGLYIMINEPRFNTCLHYASVIMRATARLEALNLFQPQRSSLDLDLSFRAACRRSRARIYRVKGKSGHPQGSCATSLPSHGFSRNQRWWVQMSVESASVVWSRLVVLRLR